MEATLLRSSNENVTIVDDWHDNVTDLFNQNVLDFFESSNNNFTKAINENFTSLNDSMNINFTALLNETVTFIVTESVHKKIEVDSPFSGVDGTILFIVSFVLSFVVCVGNMFTIYVILYTPSLKTIQNKYVLSLAYADFLVGIALITLSIFKYLGVQCHTTIAILHSTIGVSMFNLTTIAVDRYVCISRPFLHMRKFTSRFTDINIALQWVLGLSYGIVPTFLFDLGNGKDCHPFFILHHPMITFFHLVHYTICVVVTGVLYGLIAKIAKLKGDQRRKANRYVMKTLENANGKGISDSGDGGSSENGYTETISQSSSKKGSICCGKVFRCCKRQKNANDDDIKRNVDVKDACNQRGNNNNTLCDSQISYLYKKYEIPMSPFGLQDFGNTCSHDSRDEGNEICRSSDSIPQETMSVDPNASSSAENKRQKPLNKPIQTSDVQPTVLTASCIDQIRWLKQMVMVYGVFVICWTPSQIAALFYLLGACGQDPIYVLSWFGVANSALNFYIYAFMNPRFRKALNQKFKRKRWIVEFCYALCCGCCKSN